MLAVIYNKYTFDVIYAFDNEFTCVAVFALMDDPNLDWKVLNLRHIIGGTR